ncbi:MAG: prolipoprotein diacylglyceryl transferase [Planctomycetaceae bacterium]|nr:prolipoprotein diacylglyceryl transferase [Planctomycetaceae bacterium]
MHPELFRIPFTDLTVKSYGFLMVCGFIAAIFLIRRLSRDLGDHSEHITTAALYSLIAGVVGARIFYVIHYWYQFSGRILDIFAVWKGGLELLGGVLLAVFTIVMYLWVQKLPVRRYLDILGIGLLLALGFGRIGCLMNGCCFGRPTSCPVAIHFPYGSLPYESQIRPDLARHRDRPYIQLPADFFDVMDGNYYLKPYNSLDAQQKFEVAHDGPYHCLPVIPTQILESLLAFVGCIGLYFHRQWGIKLQTQGRKLPFIFKPGTTFALMFIYYGTMRFFIEYLRDDNPIQADGFTISQNLSIALIIINIALILLFSKMNTDNITFDKK